jgi:uncharacterized protein YbaR (Trm112 family)
MVSPKLLEILVCPLGKSTLKEDGDALVCARCGPRFRVSRQGYPNMLMDDAELPPGCQRIEQLPCVREKQNAAGRE